MSRGVFETVCRYCGRDIVLVMNAPGDWTAKERGDDGSLSDHFPLCAGKDLHVQAAMDAKLAAKAKGFHGAELDAEIGRIMREGGDRAENSGCKP